MSTGMRHAAGLALLLAAAFHGAALAGESSMHLESPSFADHASIPVVHTCVGEDRSPALAWKDAPAGTRSFALVVDDPDAPDPAAPKRTWVHWVLYDIPATAASLAEGAGNAAPQAPARSGRNDWTREGWGGPCPPVGRHRYFFKLYALDRELGDLGAPTKAALEEAMQGHVLARAELVGTFAK